MARLRARNRWTLGLLAGGALALGGMAAPAARAQQPPQAPQSNPVYTDDSPVAGETLSRVAEFIAAKNDAEAVRELQKLLDEQPDRVVPADNQPDLFTSVRARVHAVLLSEPRLLDQYRAAESARAKQQLDAGEADAVERSRLMTPAGFEAALRVAQSYLESGRFEAARITLEELESHPDRRGRDPKAGRDAAELLATVARYLDRDDVRQRADRWAKEAGEPAPQTAPVPLPAALRRPMTSFFSPAGPLKTEGIPPRALWSTPLEPIPVPSDVADTPDVSDGGSDQLWILPTVVGDTVYVNDGTFITARDRFTLQPRWTARPSLEAPTNDAWAARRNTRPQFIEDTSSISVYGRTLVATMGVAEQGERTGDAGAYALDADTGRLLWSTDADRLDPSLESASVRGPALIDGGTVVLAVRKVSQGRRIVSLSLVGLSLENGSLQWLRPIASAGSIPWGRGDLRISAAPLLYRGIVYCQDHLGVIAAVEAATGRPLWVRRALVPALGAQFSPDPASAYEWPVPVADGDGVVFLSPDRSEVLRLDRLSGEVLSRRASADLGQPSYLLRVGERLAAVSGDGVSIVGLADLAAGQVHRARVTGQQGVRARVVVSGDRLLVPRIDGLAVIDPSRPARDEKVLPLDHVGNVLPLDSELLLVDGLGLHSYLTWNVAEQLLKDRMTADPSDPEPAITYADLAYRSGHPDQIVGAADQALAALDRNPGSEGSKTSRQRLFKVLLAMAERSERSSGGAPEATKPPETKPEPRPAPPGRPGMTPRHRSSVATPPQPELPALDLDHLGGVVERLARAAQSADERVSYLMVLGRLRDAQGTPALAAEAYQQVLADSALSQASWKGSGASVRAELEATRRIRQLVQDRGPQAYAAFEAEAARMLEAAGPTPAAPELERLARRYPAAATTPSVWARAADAQEAEHRPYAAITDLREGLASAEAATLSGIALDQGILGELGGRLADRLRGADQIFAAAQVVTRLRTQYPSAALTDHGEAIDADALSKELSRRLAGLQRFPRIGPELRADAQSLAGWSIMSPRSRRGQGRACEDIMMVSLAQSKVALWGVPAAGPDSSASLQMLWSRDFKDQPPVLWRLDPDSVYLLWEKAETNAGPVLERISTVTGETRWRTDPFRSLFPQDDKFQKRQMANMNVVETPIDGQVRLTDLVAVQDEQSLVLVERSGRAAAFDCESGKLLWHDTTPVGQVNDIDAGAGSVVIGGVAAEPDGTVAPRSKPVVIVIDERSGRVMHTIDTLGDTAVRWVRIASGDTRNEVLVGLMAQIDAYDLTSARADWSIPGGPAYSSLDAWVFGDRLFILDQNRSLWLAPVATGQLAEHPVETFEHLVGAGMIEATAIGPGRKQTAFTSDRGVCVVSDHGVLVGMDPINGGESDEGSLLPAAVGESYFVTVDAMPRQVGDDQTAYRLYVLDTSSGRLVSSRLLSGLDLPPRRIAVLDGHVLVTAGTNTIVYPAPVADSKGK